MLNEMKDNIIQYITEKDFAEAVFDAKIIGGKLRECAFFMETYKVSFGNEDLIQISIMGYPFNALVLSITPQAGGISYIKCMVKWPKNK